MFYFVDGIKTVAESNLTAYAKDLRFMPLSIGAKMSISMESYLSYFAGALDAFTNL